MTGNPPVPDDVELIQVVAPNPDGTARWRPIEGEEVRTLMDHLALDEDAKRSVKAEATRVLARCVPPTEVVGEETGLVIGYVQSGKTMSFTTVAALARDNGYRLIIVITGISTGLFGQSSNRLLRDLQILTRVDRKWKNFENPSIATARSAIQDTLDEWRDDTVPEEERQTVLITVMKNHTHLRNLNALLAQLNLEGVSALIFDDEADQAGLNTLVNQQAQSTTYRHLLDLKAALPQHTFLQYTATPQAPLLINLIDALSPSFAELLTAGPDYTGGREFFIERRELVRIIPNAEIPTRGNVLRGPPESLLEAMRIFFLGVAAGIVQDGGRGNRSMLVHPSQETLRHAEYFRWVRDAKTHWQEVLGLPETDQDRQDVIAAFRTAYDDLAATEPDIPPFEALIARLPHALRRTREEEVNAVRRRTPVIRWHDTYGHILVGGQAMDRGFTVEGLTVTYMPRQLGGGNADTVQQRARFFGYKRGYLGYCRVFLENAAADAYRRYVTHEEDVRAQLAELNRRGQPLDMWKREFLLTRALKPTRDNVLDLPYMRFRFGGAPYAPKIPHDSLAVTASNQNVVDQFLGQIALSQDGGSNERTEMQRHLVATAVPLDLVYEQLLTRFRLTIPTESTRYTGLLLQLQQYREDHPAATCTVYVMSRGVDPNAVRERPINEAGEITTYLFQGEHPNRGGRIPRGSIYPGDVHLPSADDLQVQIHYLRLSRNGAIVAENVPTLAVILPAAMPDDVIVQPQGGPN